MSVFSNHAKALFSSTVRSMKDSFTGCHVRTQRTHLINDVLFILLEYFIVTLIVCFLFSAEREGAHFYSLPFKEMFSLNSNKAVTTPTLSFSLINMRESTSES